MSNINGKILGSIKISNNIENNLNINGTLNNTNIIGKIIGSINIDGKLENNSNVLGTINRGFNLQGQISTSGSRAYRNYEGSYDIVPSQQNQLLETENKLLNQDLLVEKIPYYETSNIYGKTIYIGSEVIVNGN